jgi:hypothetical protein
MTHKITFGINFKGMWDTYTASEMGNFLHRAIDGITDEDLRNRYMAFLENEFLEKKCVPSTPVDYDVLYTFWEDVDERASCDTEDNLDPEYDADLIAGGKYFDQIANKLKAHLDANKPPIKLTPIDTTTHRQTTKMDFIKANKEAQQ